MNRSVKIREGNYFYNIFLLFQEYRAIIIKIEYNRKKSPEITIRLVERGLRLWHVI